MNIFVTVGGRTVPFSGRFTSKNHLSAEVGDALHSTTLTESVSSRAFFFSAFIGRKVTSNALGSGSQIVHRSSRSPMSAGRWDAVASRYAPQWSFNGQDAQVGFCTLQTVLPSSIKAWFTSPGF